MPPDLLKRILEGYGVFRLILGTAQGVGLFLGYYLLEWVIRYPKVGMTSAINEEVFLLTFLAVCLRAPFHLVTGIGIARAQTWVLYWLYGGWPIMLIITGGYLFFRLRALAYGRIYSKSFSVFFLAKAFSVLGYGYF